AVCTAPYTITQADLDAGVLDNTATAQATDPTGATATSQPDSVRLPLPQHPAVALDKRADATALSAPAAAGDRVTYTFTLRNPGDVTIHGAAIADPLPGLSGLEHVWPAQPGVLAPGASATATAQYTLTQADVDAGHVSNHAASSALDPAGAPVPEPGDAQVRIDLDPSPSLSLTRTVRRAEASRAGATDRLDIDAPAQVVFDFDAANTGNVTLTQVDLVQDAIIAAGGLLEIACDTAAPITLAPGESVHCAAPYSVTQADVDHGLILSTVRATGTPAAAPNPEPNPDPDPEPNRDQTASPAAGAMVVVEHKPSVAIAVQPTPSAAEDYVVDGTVHYTIEVTNTGNVTLTQPAAREDAFTGTGQLSAIVCPADVVLAPGDAMTCGADYVLTQGDIDAGRVDLTVAATGATPGSQAQGGLPVTTVAAPPAEARVVGAQNPKLGIVKSSSLTNPAQIVAGAAVTYSFVVTNTGNVTVSGVTVVERSFTGSGTMSAVTCPKTVLAPGEQTVCTAHYTITQADQDAGRIDNTAAADGRGPVPAGQTEPVPLVPPSDTASIPTVERTELTLVKEAEEPDEWAAGQKIGYTFEVSNSGNVTVNSLAIEELDFGGAGAAPTATCPVTALAPGESTTCEAGYTLRAEDLTTGHEIANTARANGATVQGSAVQSGESTAAVDVPDPPAAHPKTGADRLPDALAAAAALMLLGGLVLAVSRRRRRSGAA
ncbi:MAG: hypothetical protein LBT54_05480, partial [Bifidobacteriaceae bacterium]|nr:hypothetical protein [Bifidobacteriaceae bacterium]